MRAILLLFLPNCHRLALTCHLPVQASLLSQTCLAGSSGARFKTVGRLVGRYVSGRVEDGTDQIILRQGLTSSPSRHRSRPLHCLADSRMPRPLSHGDDIDDICRSRTFVTWHRGSYEAMNQHRRKLSSSLILLMIAS